jgi:hypothetical protein
MKINKAVSNKKSWTPLDPSKVSVQKAKTASVKDPQHIFGKTKDSTVTSSDPSLVDLI